MSKRPHKLVIPVGGRGLRMQPATRTIPKEFLTVVDRPLVDYACAEAAQAGITEVIFVTGQNLTMLQQYFTGYNPDNLRFTYVPQAEPKGLGHAILQAKAAVNDEPFAVLLPDMLIDAEPSCLAQLLDIGAANALAVERVPEEKIGNFGIVVGHSGIGRCDDVLRLVEKPKPGEVPSSLAISGRYVFEPAIFECLESQTVAKDGELQLTDAMSKLLNTRAIKSLEYVGKSFDCGSRQGLVLAGLHFGLKRPDLRDDILGFLAPEAITHHH